MSWMRRSEHANSIDTTSWGKIHFRNAAVFYLGLFAVIVGALLHLPFFLQANVTSHGYALVGMPMTLEMYLGMALLVIGIPLTWWGCALPKDAVTQRRSEIYAHKRIKMLDNAVLNRAHWLLILTLSVALIIDMMKPITLAFVIPGMKAEYAISQSMVTLVPLAGLTGTTLGSFLWGWLGDRAGRRAAILLAAVIFIGTSVCGAMPSFNWNIVMCFIMGLSAGGLLPITMTLLAEILPTQHRGFFLIVLMGIGSIGGYFITSASATLLEPIYGWRVLWLLGLPTGVLLIFLNRYIPESPRFLFAHGREKEAHQVLQDFNAELKNDDTSESKDSPNETRAADNKKGIIQLFKQPLIVYSIIVLTYGLAWGLVNYGFFMWLPYNLRQAGLSVAASDLVLAQSAFIAFPGILLIAWLYRRWSSKKSMILYSGLTALALLAFIPLVAVLQEAPLLLLTLTVILLISSTGMTATLLPYSTEVYHTALRGLGTGLAAGSGKLGGMIGLGAAYAHITPTLFVSAILVAMPVILAMMLVIAFGIETRGRSLEETSTFFD